MSEYRNAYEIHQGIGSGIISESYFNQLINEFQKTYLASVNYFEGIKKNRRPVAFLIGIRNNLNDYHRKIQSRPEMIDHDEDQKHSGYACTTVIDIWESDKSLKTLYNSVMAYCSLRSKDFNTIAIHISEYRAINKLIAKIHRAINEINSTTKNKMPKIDNETIKRLEEVEVKCKNSKIFCYHCKGETKQIVLFEKGELAEPRETIAFDEQGKRKDSAWAIEGRIWKVFQCQGCEKINLNVFMRHSPFEDDMLIHHFPVKDFRQFPMWVTHLNKDFTELFAEIYLSLNAGNTRLPLMGARTLLDMFIVEKIGDQGSFKNKLQKLTDAKYISDSSRELLEVALEYGHATIHRGYQPNKEEINGILDIIENILHSEALKDKTKDLKKTMPKKQ